MGDQPTTSKYQDELFTKFIRDVQKQYTFSDSKIDEFNDIIISKDDKCLLFPAAGFYKKYIAYQNSALPYSDWVSKTVGYITKLATSWCERWK